MVNDVDNYRVREVDRDVDGESSNYEYDSDLEENLKKVKLKLIR